MAEGYKKRDIKRTNNLIFLAWHTALLFRIKEIPDLEDLYIKDIEKKEQTDDEMLTVVKMLNAAYGGEVVYID